MKVSSHHDDDDDDKAEEEEEEEEDVDFVLNFETISVTYNFETVLRHHEIKDVSFEAFYKILYLATRKRQKDDLPDKAMQERIENLTANAMDKAGFKSGRLGMGAIGLARAHFQVRATLESENFLIVRIITSINGSKESQP